MAGRTEARVEGTTRAEVRRTSAGHVGANRTKPGLVERVVEASSEDEIKPIDWLVPVS